MEEWSNGTALWYWIQDATFAPAEPVLSLLEALTGTLLGSVALTYGSIALEFALMLALLAGTRVRAVLWVLGLAFHLSIGLVFGLWSFFCSMAAALTLYLIRPVAMTESSRDDRDGAAHALPTLGGGPRSCCRTSVLRVPCACCSSSVPYPWGSS